MGKPSDLRHGVSFGEVLAVMVILTVLALIFFPVFYPYFAPRRTHPNGIVRDGAGRPMPGAVLRFRAADGRVVAVVTADAHGEFRRSDLRQLSQDAPDGFALTHIGGTDRYTFTPLGDQQATFRDDSGRALAGLPVVFVPDSNTWQTTIPFERLARRCGGDGTARVAGVPAGVRFTFLSQDPRWAVRRTTSRVDGTTIRYDVTLSRSATIAGRLLTPDGKPFRGAYAFVTRQTDLEEEARRYSDGVTGPSGRFRIRGLLPGTYYAAARSPQSFHSLTAAQRIVVAPGQTASVDLRAFSE